MIYSEERRITVDISKEVDRIALDGFITKAKKDGFGNPSCTGSTLAPSSLVVVIKKEESQ